MEVKTLQAHYKLIEFHCYVDKITDESIISVIELLIEMDNIDYVEEEFSNIFAVQTEDQNYVFSHYQVEEYYRTENGLVKIVCVK